MISYEIIMTPDSENDLIELSDYISDVLLAPQTAISYLREIRIVIQLPRAAQLLSHRLR